MRSIGFPEKWSSWSGRETNWGGHTLADHFEAHIYSLSLKALEDDDYHDMSSSKKVRSRFLRHNNIEFVFQVSFLFIEFFLGYMGMSCLLQPTKKKN